MKLNRGKNMKRTISTLALVILVFVSTASSLHDSNGTIIPHEWNFGDGGAGERMILTRSYASMGSFAVTLKTKNPTTKIITGRNAEPTVSISTDKYEYEAGDTMLINIMLVNPSDRWRNVRFVWRLDFPDYGLRIPIINNRSLWLPPGFSRTFTLQWTLPSWNLSFAASWYVALYRASELICEDSADWKYIQRWGIVVIFTSSTYKVVKEKPSGWFESGQNADIVLGWFDFNYSGGPLFFNHPMGISTDGEHLLLADARNNRILIWNKLPDGNVPPDIVLGQPDFYSSDPGDGMDELNWPVDVTSDGEHVVVADTYNNRILIWKTFPIRNGQPADVVLEDFGEERIAWPWGVRIVDGKLLASSTAMSKVYVWNEIPEENNTPPDMVLTAGGMFGTPRGIWSDGERLVVVDHNARFETYDGMGATPGLFFWREFPEGDEPCDFFMEGFIFGPAMTEDGKFLALLNYGLAIWNSFPENESDEPDLIIGSPDIMEWEMRRAYRFDAGDGSSIAVAGDRMYISLYNANNIVAYRSVPENESHLPDFSVGSPTIWNDTYEENYFFESANPVSDGEHLFSISGYEGKMYVWRKMPAESGAEPDIVYVLKYYSPTGLFEPQDIALYNNTLAVSGTNSLIFIWNSLPLNGELPDVVIDLAEYLMPPKGEEEVTVSGISLDAEHMYAWANNWLYIWNGTPTEPRPPDLLIFMPESISRIFSDGEHLITSTTDRKVEIFKLSDIINASAPFEMPPPKEGDGEEEPEPEQPPEGLPEPNTLNLTKIVLSKYTDECPLLAPTEVFSDGKHLFVADNDLGLVLIWSEFPTEDDERPDIAIGRGVQVNSRDGLFWPQNVWFDGHWLWVGEVKFSGRLVRFPVRAEVEFPPVASFDWSPREPLAGETITFNASSSYDDAYITRYRWNFGDGNVSITTEPLITHLYCQPENYTVTLTVTDDKGLINSTSKVVTVLPK